MEEKPPVGILPRKLHVQSRVNDIISAMNRYNLAGKSIPNNWFEELYELIPILTE